VPAMGRNALALLALMALVACTPAPPRDTVIYGIGAPGVGEGSVLSYALPSARRLGEFTATGGQGGSFAASPDGSRGFFFDSRDLHELALPGLQLVRSVSVPDPVQLIGGSARLVAVAPSGAEVYVATGRDTGPLDREFGIAVYDTSAASFGRQFWLPQPACGPAELFALGDQRLALLCHADLSVRVIDARDGQQLGPSLKVEGANVVMTPDRKRLFVVSRRALLQEVDLDTQTISRAGTLINCRDCVPYQPLHLSADAAHLTMIVARGLPGTSYEINANVAWIVDTGTFSRIYDVPLGPGTLDAFEMPGGQTLVMARQPSELRLIEVPSGKPLHSWPAPSYSLEIP
jgi:DNA-binding beta-propeller fold protein YncE